jgi:hypothetical protein
MWNLDGRPSKESLRNVSVSHCGNMQLLISCIWINSGGQGAFEHFSAVNFFAEFANDVPRFRHYISGSAGIPFLIKYIKAVDDSRVIDVPNYVVWDLCEKLAELSAFRWCVPILLQQDICPTLVNLLR